MIFILKLDNGFWFSVDPIEYCIKLKYCAFYHLLITHILEAPDVGSNKLLSLIEDKIL